MPIDKGFAVAVPKQQGCSVFDCGLIRLRRNGGGFQISI